MARDYKREYRNYQGTEEQKNNRAARGRARYALEKEGRVHKGDGKDVDHKRPLSKGGSNSESNLRVVSKAANRSFPRDSKGRIR
jgi:5-methylcytosine-specific restriction endonuclease McrA